MERNALTKLKWKVVIFNVVSILQAEEEMRQRVALIAKIRAIESVPVIRFKVFYLYCLYSNTLN